MKRLISLFLAVSLLALYNTAVWAAGSVSEKTVIQGQYSGERSVVEQYSQDYIGPSVAGEKRERPIIIHEHDSEWSDIEEPASTEKAAKKWKPNH